MSHPGVGPLTALAFVLIIGTLERFKFGKQIGSYVGLIPCESSSAGHQRRDTGDASAKEHRQGGHGPKTRGSDSVMPMHC